MIQQGRYASFEKRNNTLKRFERDETVGVGGVVSSCEYCGFELSLTRLGGADAILPR